jgi:hypothetical protein
MDNRACEFIQALRLMEVFPESIVAAAALDAIRLSAINFDAVKQLVIAKVERRPAKLDLCDYPYLPAAPASAEFRRLLIGQELQHGGNLIAATLDPKK